MSQSNRVELERNRERERTERDINTYLNAQTHSCTPAMNRLRSPQRLSAIKMILF